MLAGLPLAALLGTAADAQDRLQSVFRSGLVVNGSTTMPDGRLFLAAQPAEPAKTSQVIDVKDRKPVP